MYFFNALLKRVGYNGLCNPNYCIAKVGYHSFYNSNYATAITTGESLLFLTGKSVNK